MHKNIFLWITNITPIISFLVICSETDRVKLFLKPTWVGYSKQKKCRCGCWKNKIFNKLSHFVWYVPHRLVAINYLRPIGHGPSKRKCLWINQVVVLCFIKIRISFSFSSTITMSSKYRQLFIISVVIILAHLRVSSNKVRIFLYLTLH